MQTVLITGGTGLVGTALTKMLLEKGYKVCILTRELKKSSDPNLTFALWNVKNKTIDKDAVINCDYIIHLAGAGVVDKKWTKEYKEEIESSRTESSKLLADVLNNNENKVRNIVSASAIGYYGADKGKAFIESDSPADNFLGNTCRLWEESVETIHNKPVCKLRCGIVLSDKGGALKEFIKPIKFGIATILGSGKQVISWIHISDLCRMYIYAMENSLNGSFNAVSPAPASNKFLVTSLAKELKNNFYTAVKVPAFVLKIMMGERSVEVLKSTTVSCNKIKESGFVFNYPSLESAFKNLFR